MIYHCIFFLLTLLTLVYGTKDIVVCPDGDACLDKETCCLLPSGNYGCCPVPNGVCCSDRLHCCPNGYTCNIPHMTCDNGNINIPMHSSRSPEIINETKRTANGNKQVSSSFGNGKNVLCPDGISNCPPETTCCKLTSGQYGCCPMPKAVCCSDHAHCCPNGYKCNITAKTCTKGIHSVPMAVKVSSVSIKGQNVMCPDGISKCPHGTTCCKLTSGQYGCCPMPKAVCCSDHAHCCPNGYKCDISAKTCTKGIHSVPMAVKVSSVSMKGQNIMCPDGISKCPHGETCCKLANGQYGCCPLPKAVCCSDHTHCCPHGYKCDVSAGTCTKGSHSVPLAVKVSSVSIKGPNVMCADGISECPGTSTCCKLASGHYGCCPLPKAVCCADLIHCCPNGYKCGALGCFKGIHSVPMAVKVASVSIKPHDIICPDGISHCLPDRTCCKLSSGLYGCCPMPKAVCCSDNIHCCPNGYICDILSGTCNKSIHSVPMAVKVSSVSITAQNVMCSDGISECPALTTCCKLADGKYGCCPLPNAVCCSDHIHCCPSGYKCDTSAGTCNKGIHTVAIAIKVSSIFAKAGSVICPDGQSECPDGNTCCRTSTGEYGCCPLPSAVCCSDYVHCCPNGYKCDISSGTCTNGMTSIPLFVKVKGNAIKESNVAKIKCPDGRTECPGDSTCCMTASEGYGCCPLLRASCCSDGVHCCPEGYRCDVIHQKCVQREKIIAFVNHIKATVHKNGKHAMQLLGKALKPTNEPNVVYCKGGELTCPDKQTCCRTPGGWGCCPLPGAVCCSDEKHCCPHDTTCNLKTHTCTPQIKGNEIPLFKKTSALRVTPQTQLTLGNIICPDEQSQCANGETCCEVSSGTYGCCPMPKAVCCSDNLHCCPHGTECDVESGSCESATSSVDEMVKLMSKNSDYLTFTPVDAPGNVLCPDHQSICPTGSTCCKLASSGYGCCGYEKATCCSDGIHCCPHGKTCDLVHLKCVGGHTYYPLLKKVAAFKLPNSVMCPDNLHNCQNGMTCCLIGQDEYGCCPLPNAVCCNDHKHCCPSNTKCDTETGKCIGKDTKFSLIKKIPAMKENMIVVCPDMIHACTNGLTCCLISKTVYGCCPLSNAVCCTDYKHCCPHGTTCDLKTHKCLRGITEYPLVRKVFGQVIAIKVGQVLCPNKEQVCPDGNTCCLVGENEYGCCPYVKATCCSDKVHCCPQGFRCGAEGTCFQEGTSTISASRHVKAMALQPRPLMPKMQPPRPLIPKDTLCKDNKTKCITGTSCCRDFDGTYNCCPIKEAICCNDHVHCCPVGWICNTEQGVCRHPTTKAKMSLLKKIKGRQ